jgi:hypothetical protein
VTTTITNHPLFILFTAIFETLTLLKHSTQLNHITNDSSKNLTHKKNLFEMEVEKGLKPLVLGKV